MFLKPKECIYLDENQVVIESIRLEPSIQKLVTIPINPDYIILIIGEGEIYITA